jgi:hypothetical protein
MCEYKLVKCPACQSEIPQKNLAEHQLQCASVLMTSENCQVTYKPNAPPSFYSEMNDLREQFQQYRFAAQSEIQQLRQELRIVQSNYVIKIHLFISISDDLFFKMIKTQCWHHVVLSWMM